jgi:hypothetical protein
MSESEALPELKVLIANVYAAFNRRDVEGALALMSERVSWPMASEGGRVLGKAEICDYWTRQWKEFDPNVDPLEVIDRGAGKADVRVHQVVKNIEGLLLSDSQVWHGYTFSGGLIERMDLIDGGGGESSPSAAFSGR